MRPFQDGLLILLALVVVFALIKRTPGRSAILVLLVGGLAERFAATIASTWFAPGSASVVKEVATVFQISGAFSLVVPAVLQKPRDAVVSSTDTK